MPKSCITIHLKSPWKIATGEIFLIRIWCSEEHKAHNLREITAAIEGLQRCCTLAGEAFLAEGSARASVIKSMIIRGEDIAYAMLSPSEGMLTERPAQARAKPILE